MFDSELAVVSEPGVLWLATRTVEIDDSLI